MGLTHVPVTVSNFITNDSFTASFLIDTGATDSMAPASELKRIGIEPVRKQVYELANGQFAEFEVGDAKVSFLEETIALRFIFGPDGAEPILGVIALESAGLVVDPKNQRLSRIPVLPLKKITAEIAAR
jgi:clan AA aspartic protease